MQTILVFVLVGIISGMAIGMQGPMASIITQQLGVLESVFIVHLGGALVSLFPLLLLQNGGKLSQWRELPWYVLLAGVFGLVVLASISFLIPRIGASSAIILIMVGQVIIGVVLDHYGLLGAEVHPINLPRLGGILVIFLGLWITLKN